MNERSKIFIDENKQFQFDFTNALEVYQIHGCYQCVPGSLLSDVDFIVERKENILLIEYKNCNIVNAVNPSAFMQKITKDEFHCKIARKYYDSLLFVLTQNRTKPVHFIFLLECTKAISTDRKEIRNKIMKKLPFEMQKRFSFAQKWISEFSIYSINEWNQTFPDFLVSSITKKR